MKRFAKFVSLILALTMILALLPSCSNSSTGAGSSSAPSPSAGTASPSNQHWKLVYDYYSTEFSEPAYIDKWYLNEVAKRSDGRIEIDYYYSGALHKTGEHYQAVQDGGCDITFLNYGYYSTELPISRGVEWKFRDSCTQAGADGFFHAINDLYDENETWHSEYEDYNMHVLYMSNWGNEACLFKKDCTSYKDLAGQKLRTYGIEGDVMAAFGAVPMSIANNDTYTSIETGVIDGITSFGLRTAATMALHEQAPYIVDIGSGIQGPSAVVIRKDLWDSFPDDIKAIFEEVRQELLNGKFGEIMNNTATEAVKTMIADNCTFTSWSDEAVTEASAIAVPVLEQNWFKDMTDMNLMSEQECKDFLARLDELCFKYAPEKQCVSFTEIYNSLKK